VGAIEAIILGIIQGLTEFLPVSSSGHLELAKSMFGSVPEEGMLMTIILHFATALSTCVIFRKDIADIFRGLFKFKNNDEFKFSFLIVLSMIPAAAVGVFLEDDIDRFFSGNILLVGFMLILTGGLLFLADRAKDSDKKVQTKSAVIVGISQAIAILPGISRSGATIGISVLLGIDRSRAARFSFLMVVPLIFGAMAVKGKKYVEIQSLEGIEMAEDRTPVIMEELTKDFEFADTVDVEMVSLAVFQKERAWEMAKNGFPGWSKDSVTKYYRLDLSMAGVHEAQIDEITADDMGKVRPFTSTSITAILLGFIFAFLTGLVACKWMIKLVKNSKLIYFSIYCFIAGTGAIIWSLL